MAESTPNAAESVREMARERWAKAVLLFVLMAALLFVAWSFSLLKSLPAIAFSALAFLVIYKIGSRVLDRAVDRYLHAKWGAKAEEQVAVILSSLGGDYRIFHDVQSKFGNIDHLVIRKDGAVIVVETKSHQGRVKVVGDELRHGSGKPFEKNFINQTLQNIYAIREHIGTHCDELPWVTGIIVFTRAYVEARAPIKGITICNMKYLPTALSRAKPNPAYAGMLWDQWQISSMKLN